MKQKSHFKSVIVFAIVLLTIIIFLPGAIVHADDDSTGGLVPCNNKCTLCHILVGLQNIFKYLMGLLFVATMFFVTLNGALMMVSAGSKKILEQVKTALNYCLKGFLLFLICWVIITGIMRTLGYKQLNNWWEFECDTTQVEPPVQPPTPSPAERKCADMGGICRIWNTSMEGQSKCEEEEQPWGQYKCENSGEVCCVKKTSWDCADAAAAAQKVIKTYMDTQVGLKYGGDVHCWSTTNAAYTLSGLPGIGNLKWEPWDGNEDSIKPGDVMQTSKHTFLVLYNGATSSAPPNGYIGVNRDGLNYNIKRAKREGTPLRIIHIADVVCKNK
ncbi:MAG: hypothetical protein A2359_01425 [Candidatus Moranbacteria bacterium RIFOXYB1_FULL_43_19]|nr:MAG: hypothetical protein A2359_01425 [Candidatus Moranbacteria bacterium RIFOXYB1_FULL_43_19]OGI33512.1 MAG: hypothetical protein A2420_00060 [Candidatus Moranbacteria bacterium RIFOXYC1_FULL_44_13]OGI38386.1 MAG: hypothetical protein A2612_02645 [Candidatus Moranbacteria bacterium RIFOXYD1_FULL_44_12]